RLRRCLPGHRLCRRPPPAPHRQIVQSSFPGRDVQMSSRPLSEVQPDGFFTDRLAQADPAIASAIAAELEREQNQIELIASENIVSRAVLEAQGSVFTNKYAEGYPGRRYYQGCAPSDQVEQLAIDRAKQ